MYFDVIIFLTMIFLVIVIILYLPIFLILKKKGKGLLQQLGSLLFVWAFLLIILIIFVTLTSPINLWPLM